MNFTRDWRVVTTVGLGVLGAMGNGCSLLYTKGPEPYARPPPPCTTSNEAPIADTVLAAASVGAIVGGAIIANNTKNCGGSGCGLNNGLTGDGLIILGGIGTLLFIPSAGVGFSRTADCRQWLERNPQSAPQPASRMRPPGATSSLILFPGACSSGGDAPLLCVAGPLRE